MLPRVITVLLVVMQALAGCTAAPGDSQPQPGDLPVDFVPVGDEFLVVLLPDTQIYARDFPASLELQLLWVAERAEQYRIVFVSHVGDVVHNASEQVEWDVARAAYSQLDDIDAARKQAAAEGKPIMLTFR